MIPSCPALDIIEIWLESICVLAVLFTSYEFGSVYFFGFLITSVCRSRDGTTSTEELALFLLATLSRAPLAPLASAFIPWPMCYMLL